MKNWKALGGLVEGRAWRGLRYNRGRRGGRVDEGG
jgi:hypothetical protein